MGKQRRPRLLVLASTYPRWAGDVEPGFVHELTKRLAVDFDVIVIAPHAPGAAREEDLDGVRVLRYRYAPVRFETLVNNGGIVTNLRRARWKWILVPTFILMGFWGAWRLTRRWRPDVVHAHWLLPQGLVAALLAGLISPAPSLVVTSHGADLFALRGRLLDALKRFVVRHAETVTVVSTTMRDELVRIGIARDRIRVQPMGVDLDGSFTPDPRVIRAPHKLLFVGRLVEKKGLRHLIDAMPYILSQHPSASLVVAGFGPEEAARREQAARLGVSGHVSFIGAVPQADLPDLYRSAAVFVAPFVRAESGDQEGLGLVLVEAAGCGCQVVTSDLPTVHDVFEDSQVRLAEAGSPASLTEAVSAALSAPRSIEESERVRASLVARFDWRVVAARYASILAGSEMQAPRH